MSDKIKFIIFHLNRPPFSKNYNLISFDSITPEELLQILNDVLSEIDSGNKVDVKAEEPEETTVRLLSMLRVLKYDPGDDPVGFRQGLVQGEKHIIHPILEWLLKNMEDLKKRAYLAKFLVKVEIPMEMLSDPGICSLYEHYEELIEEFKNTHKELVALKTRGAYAAELRSDIDAMEKEKDIVSKKIERAARKLENVENKAELIEAARALRLERERQKELAAQRATEMEMLQELQQTSGRLAQQLSDLRQATQGTTPQGLIKNLEEELKMTSYIATEKLPKEIEACKKEVEILSRVANSPMPTPAKLDSLRQQIEMLGEEVSELAQRGLDAKEGSEDNLAPYRQQAQIMARRKEETADLFSETKNRLAELNHQVKSKMQETASSGDKNSQPMTEKEFKEYVSKLKVRSALYKAKKAQLSTLVTEAGILARTIDILNQYLEAIPSGESMEGRFDADLESVPKEEILQQINYINNQITSHKTAISSKIQELRETREKHNELLEEYTDKKRAYDAKAATLNSSIARLEQDVKEMRKEEEADLTEANLLEAKTDILKALLERAESEGLQSNTGEKPSYRSRLEARVAEAEKINSLLREEQQSVKQQAERNAKQRLLWSNLEMLLKCKEECIEAEKLNDGVLKRTDGTETLQFE